MTDARPDAAWRAGIAGRDKDEIVLASEVHYETPKDGPARVILRTASGEVAFSGPVAHVLFVRRHHQSLPAVEFPRLTEPKLRALIREVVMACLEEDAQKPAPG